jgi:predicted component of type VI protein secretion system
MTSPEPASPPPQIAGLTERLLGRAAGDGDSDQESTARALDALDEFLEFLHRGIKHRQEFQREVSPDVTQVVGGDPNPLMNTSDLGRIRAILFDPARTRTTAAARAVLADALRRIELHLLGLVAMYEHAPRATLRVVDPERIEEQVPAAMRVQPLKGYRAWEVYRETVSELQANPARLFHEVWPELLRRYIAVHEKRGNSIKGSSRGT